MVTRIACRAKKTFRAVDRVGRPDSAARFLGFLVVVVEPAVALAPVHALVLVAVPSIAIAVVSIVQILAIDSGAFASNFVPVLPVVVSMAKIVVDSFVLAVAVAPIVAFVRHVFAAIVSFPSLADF